MKIKDLKLSEEILTGIFNDYWDSNHDGTYKLNTKEIINKYEIPIPSNALSELLIYNNKFRICDTCKFCGKPIYLKNRSSETYFYRQGYTPGCSCGYIGVCGCCGQLYKEHKKINDIGYCFNCYINLFNLEREFFEGKVKKNTNNNLTEDENKILNIFTYHNNKIFDKNNTIDFNQISFLFKKSVKYTKELYEKIRNKGYIEIRAYINDNGNINHSIGVITIPIKKIFLDADSIVTPIIPSKPAREIFHILREFFPIVFAEAVPSSFINFDKIKENLDPEECKWFFTNRIDILCTDDNFIPQLAVEYNGDYHFNQKNNIDYKKRRFKKRICELVNIPFTEINSYKQIKKLKDDLNI